MIDYSNYYSSKHKNNSHHGCLRPVTIDLQFKELPINSILDWVKENIYNDWYWSYIWKYGAPRPTAYQFSFETEADVMYFSMRWK